MKEYKIQIISELDEYLNKLSKTTKISKEKLVEMIFWAGIKSITEDR